ncbi:S24 family peptidase [Halanaerobacter jeridensis]|uniref:SOS-response transcriptional repressor LexA n=1 Tax=Halanaerobacter jeridensis TaxID=706427 RepID=A0A939BNS5_9FIRM|nr:S24 family peptidase [Halanaerobacter jeridensis]MBM7555743.1 SOS-response transcriptional repressor LexA [Halanaerobacter jeridensis]
MFNKKKFKELINHAIGDRSITQYSEESNVNRTYISKIINESLDNPPSPEILKKLASYSEGRVSYKELMLVAGYLNKSQINTSIKKENLVKGPVIKDLRQRVFNTANIEQYKTIHFQSIDITNPFFFHAKDNSMINQGIKKDSLILIDQQATINNKDIIACTVESRELIRKIEQSKEKITLTAAHPDYKAITIDKNKVNIIGKCITSVTNL